MTDPHNPITRRRILQGFGALGAVTAIGGLVPTMAGAQSSPATVVPPRWDDPATWGGRVPSPSEVVTVDRPVLVSGNLRVAGIVVGASGALVFDPGTTTTVESSGNVVIRGRLVMQPVSASISHTLRFVNIDERRFVGGGHVVLASDVGLWVEGAGRLEVAGAEKAPWLRAAGAVPKGARTLTLAADPIGWQVGDEVTIVPTVAPTAGAASWSGYDTSTVAAVAGRTITLTSATAFDHPFVAGRWGAEILNLTRNTRIEGTATGRAHIHMNHLTTAQAIRNLAVRYMGPRQDTTDTYRSGGRRVAITKDVLGRYGLHLHMAGNHSAGSLIENVVVRDTGSHAFVAHESHGVTFRGCISHNTWEDAYWWDPKPAVTNQVRYDRCVASLVQADPPHRGYRLAGFAMLAGTGNSCVDSVAVGVRGNSGAAGFLWIEFADSMWTFDGNIAHNNKTNGIFVWQNNGNPHLVERFTGYHNGYAGIEHGAYRNGYVYRAGDLYGNGRAGFILHSSSARALAPMSIDEITMDGAGVSLYGIEVLQHRLPAAGPSLFRRCTMLGHRTAGIALTHDSDASGLKEPHLIDVVDCRISGNPYWLHKGIPAPSVVRVSNGSQAFALRRVDQAGELVQAWNARRQAAAPFTA